MNIYEPILQRNVIPESGIQREPAVCSTFCIPALSLAASSVNNNELVSGMVVSLVTAVRFVSALSYHKQTGDLIQTWYVAII